MLIRQNASDHNVAVKLLVSLCVRDNDKNVPACFLIAGSTMFLKHVPSFAIISTADPALSAAEEAAGILRCSIRIA